MCKRDILFYINTFVYTYDPRLVPNSTKIPFLTFDFQDDGILQLVDAIQNGYDILIEKSREEGASWIILTVYKWFWTFYPLQAFTLVSRNEQLVDKNEDPKCLFWKLMFIIENEPNFIMSDSGYNKTHLHLYNKINGSVMDGETTTGDIGRGGRCTSMMLDEFASVPDGHAALSATRDTTRCRIFNSTPKGAGNAFYDLRHKTKTKVLKFHWSQDPRKNKGLYTTKGGKIVYLDDFKGYCRFLDTSLFYPDNWNFILDAEDKPRSPWYDNECARAANKQEIAQELDIDYLGSDYPFFDHSMLREMENRVVRQPSWQGEYEYDMASCNYIKLTEIKGGRLKMWLNPDLKGHIDSRLRLVCGIDIAAGTGASNSVITFANEYTGEEVAQWVCPNTRPEELANLAVSMCRHFNDAYLIWDAGGHGSTFGKKVMELNYTNIYFRQDEKSIAYRISKIPGYYFTRESKRDALSSLREAMHKGEYLPRNQEFFDEARQYVFMLAAQAIEHAGASSTIDPSGAKDNHGDRVIASSLCNKAIKVIKTNVVSTENENKPLSCYAYRRQKYEQDTKKKDEW